MATEHFGSKSDAIRNYLKSNPGARPSAIVAALQAQGISVSLGLAKVVKYSKARQTSAEIDSASANAEASQNAASPKPAVSGSASIRQYMAEHPQATPRQIEAGLKAAGITVKLGLINAVKYSRRNKQRTGPETHEASPPLRGDPVNPALQPLIARLLAVKQFADSMGGTAQLRMMLDLIEQLR
ncbi:MAG: hypothetical protein JSS02_19975 [Planctomycetes bacterium]|nr:hypothetical protein [Planctomycetota bacterium]